MMSITTATAPDCTARRIDISPLGQDIAPSQSVVAAFCCACHIAVAETAYHDVENLTETRRNCKAQALAVKRRKNAGWPMNGPKSKGTRPMTLHVADLPPKDFPHLDFAATDFLPPEALVAPPKPAPRARHFPVLFLSDLHLGSRACRDEALLSFLQGHTADVIYLVGDIIDTWLPLGAYWTAAQHQVLAILFDRARQGTRLVYTPGNHDAFFRRFIGQHMLGIEVVDRIIHETAAGTRYLVVHGDEGDVFETHFPLLSRMSARFDSGLRGMINFINRQRAKIGWKEWQLIDRLVKGFNDAVRACDAFEERLAEVARKSGADGIICGHFHKPALHSDHGVSYANCGDWVENATALVETTAGRLLLIDWAQHGVEKAASDVHMGFRNAANGA